MARGLILLARHPRPLIGARVCYGRTDVALAEPPERGAAALVRVIGELRIDRVITSPLSRASLVAVAVAREYGAVPRADDRLVEMDFGDWENRPWTAIPRPDIDAWAADPLRYRPGGGENVETVLLRVRRAWSTIASSEGTTLVVTHAGPIRCLLHVALNVPLLDAIKTSIAYGSVVEIPSGQWRSPMPV